MSLKNYSANTEANSPSEMTLGLYALREAQQTHRLATRAEIDAFLAHQNDQKRLIESLERRAAAKRRTITPVEVD
jgi:hypothetical protein